MRRRAPYNSGFSRKSREKTPDISSFRWICNGLFYKQGHKETGGGSLSPFQCSRTGTQAVRQPDLSAYGKNLCRFVYRRRRPGLTCLHMEKPRKNTRVFTLYESSRSFCAKCSGDHAIPGSCRMAFLVDNRLKSIYHKEKCVQHDWASSYFHGFFTKKYLNREAFPQQSFPQRKSSAEKLSRR